MDSGPAPDGASRNDDVKEVSTAISPACHMRRGKSGPLGSTPTGDQERIPMADIALPGSIEPARTRGPDLDKGFHPLTGVIYLGIVAAALLFVAYSIYVDVDPTGA